MAKAAVMQANHPRRAMLGVFASALLLSAGFIPELYGVTIWFALVPALVAARRLTLKRLFWLSWMAGYLHCVLVYYWVMIVTVPGGLLLPVYLGIYWPLFFLAVEVLARKFAVPRLVSSVALWPALEWVRGTALTGLPWFYLGHSLYRWPRLIQSADLGGVLLLSAIVFAVNALLASAVDAAANRPRRTWLAACAVALFAANLAYGAWRLETVALSPGPTVACVQPNVPQSIKITQSAADSAAIFQRLRRYTLDDRVRSADVIFWPETMMPGLIGVKDFRVSNGMDVSQMLDELELQGVLPPPKREAAIRLAQEGEDLFDALQTVCGTDVSPNLETYSLLAATARIAGKPLVAGAILTAVNGDDEIDYNRVCQFAPDGREVSHYDKVHLVPFGEFIPFRESFPPAGRLLARLMPVQPSVYPGPAFEVLKVGGYNYGPAICFEDTFSYIGRRYRRLGADILVNVTNDGWFGGSFELEAHLASAVLRAVETRMAVVRAANTGISAVVSPAGVVTARLADSAGRDREIEGLLVAPVAVSRQRTIYTAVGDMWLIVPFALSPVSRFVRRRRAACKKRSFLSLT